MLLIRYRSYLLKDYSCKGRLNGPIWYEHS
uniref:Uncharacterized protein n=1 Tax=Arundo donax TaxID=35708 RepID=A0A0A9HEW0_ARUDO